MTMARFVRGAIVVFAVLGVLSGWAWGEGPGRLNNLVSELARFTDVPVAADSVVRFTNPREDWVYVSLDAEVPAGARVQVALPDGRVMADGANPEGMRFLPAGEQVLRVTGEGVATVRSIVVRSVAELQYSTVPATPSLKEQGPYDWAFLKAHVLPHVNTLIGSPTEEHIDEWIARGGKWLAGGGMPSKPQGRITAEEAFQAWLNNPGIQDPRLSGVIVDEFQGRQHPDYPAWIAAVRKLGSAEAFTSDHDAFYAYCGGPSMYTRPQTRELVRTVFDIGSYMVWERYLNEMPTLEQAQTFLDRQLGDEMKRWRETFPGCEKRMLTVAPIFTSVFSMDVQPEVDYKAWLDMQIGYYADNPAFDGLFGLQYLTSPYADEEVLRWACRLFRHYGIEGKTEPLSAQYGYTYALDHVSNPDFNDGLEGWTVEAASEGSVEAGYMERLANLEGRYWLRGGTPDAPAGNAFLKMKRDANRPNRVSQEIRNLKPGTLYSVKLISADWSDLAAGITEEKKLGLSLSVEGAETVADKGYQATANSATSFGAGEPFTGGKVAWFNHHRVVFRATAPTARLVLSDWLGDATGGPAGQEILCNFVQVQRSFDG
jgi:hypothetical protein